MEVFAGLSVCALILAALVVAIRTFALWRRTRGLPELLLSLYLTCATVLGYPLMITSTRIPASKMMLLHLAGQLVTSVGFACLLFFTLRCSEPKSSGPDSSLVSPSRCSWRAASPISSS